ncbi:DNA alkylation repair protein [Paraburkholderia diazotrophica]|uniref:3-methyladenine DNA glycosylase AlkD n=1 Tax=Paraburkholderia diazotrophica TaxID=667676 RepID=A0A1H7E7M3_9BURK|nr:DNA alkylation repair protein [Paraburkholderia diazotrophica]SEK09901.1 3-methyladenine DNA glycosylase AlkD [Paraburkholderia diazotrophica]
MSTRPKQFADAVEAAFRPLANPEQAAKMERYMLNRYVFLGLPAPVRRGAVRMLIAQPWQSSHALLDAAQVLWNKAEREYCYTAIDLLMRHHRLLSTDDISTLRQLLEQESWWETVDGLTSVIGAVLLASDRASGKGQASMDEWVWDANFWVRRAAMLHQRGWRLNTDTQRLFCYAEQLAGEKEFFIRKAIGWALRDYARWDDASVRKFVRVNMHTLSPLTVREALKRL